MHIHVNKIGAQNMRLCDKTKILGMVIFAINKWPATILTHGYELYMTIHNFVGEKAANLLSNIL